MDASKAASDYAVPENLMTDSTPSSILIIRPSALGDVCRTVPVLASLRSAWPDARIGWLVQEEFADVVSAHPSLDEVVPFPRQALRGAWRSPRRLLRSLSYLKGLARPGWELALDCQGLARSGLFARCSRARRRIGFAGAAEFGWVFLTERVATSERHVVDRTMQFDVIQSNIGTSPMGLCRPHTLQVLCISCTLRGSPSTALTPHPVPVHLLSTNKTICFRK